MEISHLISDWHFNYRNHGGSYACAGSWNPIFLKIVPNLICFIQDEQINLNNLLHKKYN